MIRIAFFICLFFSCALVETATAQEKQPAWNPGELRELFNYCEKPDLMKQLNLSEQEADKVGDIDYWGRLQYLKIDANTNDTFATKNEVQEEMIKRYKNIHLSNDQVKALLSFKENRETHPASCPLIVLNYNKTFQPLTPQQATLQLQTKYRKQLVDKLGINGRQANMLCEAEVWRQKEAISIATIPENNFERVRKTVTLNEEAGKRFKALGLSDDQVNTALQFFTENSLDTPKK
jgi:hypothetical protein